MASKPKAYTERQAIDALHALAARWPQTIGLFSWSGSLRVVRWPPREDGMEVYVSTVETIHGIPNDGGDPHADPQQGESDVE